MARLRLATMPRILIILAALLLSACAHHHPPAEAAPSWAGLQRKACLPEAIAMRQRLTERGIQARVLTYYTPSRGHAICAYLYPPGANQLWAWDSAYGSIRIRAWWADPYSIARTWLLHVERSTETLTRAEFLDAPSP